MSTETTVNAWKQRERAASLVLAVAARRQAIMDRMLRYREENARPEDKQKGKPLPQEEAASRAGVGYRQWQRWENGETMPHQSNLQQLAKRLRIPVAEFYDAEEPDETRGETPDLSATFDGAMPDDLRAQLNRIEAAIAELREAQAKQIKSLRAALAREIRRSDRREPPSQRQDDEASPGSP